MAAGAVIFNGNIIADVEVSSKQSETHNFQSTATEFAIQDGSLVSDHVILKPIDLEVTFTAANTIGGGKTPQQVFDIFKAHWANRDLLKVVTEHASYENMVIIGFEPVHKSPNKGALGCTLKLHQMNFLNLSKVPFVNATTPSAQLEVNRGTLAPVRQ